MEALVAFPTWVPDGMKEEARALGAEVIEVDGDLPTTGKVLHERIRNSDWLDGSTWKTPWRVEGKKTIAFELAGRYGEDLPDRIIFPTGGGVGIVALWKGFGEVRRRCPRLVVAQMARCAPIVRAHREGERTVPAWSDPVDTVAHGLNVTAVGGGRMVLQALRETDGSAMDVTEEEVAETSRALSSEEGLWTSPEGAAAAAALLKLVEDGQVERDERCLVCLTASGLKYSVSSLPSSSPPRGW
jgi:threonine synthase